MDLGVGAHTKDFVRRCRSWDDAHAVEFDVFFLSSEVFVFVTLLLLFLFAVQIVEVNAAINTCGGEAHVIFEPGNAFDSLHVARVLHALWQLVRVEVVDMDFSVSLSSSACKEMSTVGKANLSAAFDGQRGLHFDVFREEVADVDLVWQSHDKVQTTRMEGDGHALVSHYGRLHLHRSFLVVPNADRLVS